MGKFVYQPIEMNLYLSQIKFVTWTSCYIYIKQMHNILYSYSPCWFLNGDEYLTLKKFGEGVMDILFLVLN